MTRNFSHLFTFLFLMICYCLLAHSVGPRESKRRERPKVVVLSTRPYHFDVSAFMIYHMKRLGFTTEVWLRSSFIDLNVDGAHSLFKSLNVASIRNVGDSGKVNKYLIYPDVLRLLVVSSADGESDLVFLCRIGVFERLYALAERVVFVVHNARNAPLVAKYCIKPKCTILVLAQHVIKAANRRIQASRYKNSSVVVGVPTRVYDLPAAYLSNLSLPRIPLSPLAAEKSHSTRHIVIQGTLSKERRNYDAFFQCLTEIQKKGRQFKVHMVGWRRPTLPRLTLPRHLVSSIDMHENLKFEAYFPIIAQSDLLVTFSNSSYLYYSDRGTSTVPTGLNCGVGLAMPASMLQLYPCLQNQVLHKNISRENDCESLKAAMELTDQQMARLKEEAVTCRRIMMQGASDLLLSIAQAPISALDSSALFGKCGEAFQELRLRPMTRRKP